MGTKYITLKRFTIVMYTKIVRPRDLQVRPRYRRV